MKGRILTSKAIQSFKKYLREEEKSKNTIEKYIRDVWAFTTYMNGAEITKESVIAYKDKLISESYAVRSINSMLASLNSLFSFLNWMDCRVKSIKLQRQIYCSEEKELTKAEYMRLVNTAKQKGNERLNLILQTICSTGIRVSELQYITVEAVKCSEGIRVSELQYITVEAVKCSEAVVSLKGKTRSVFIVKELKKKLLRYAAEQKIKNGVIFVTRTGKPISRTNIWREMKGLCEQAGVNPQKVFPHNLRHLFARVFYGIEKDIAKEHSDLDDWIRKYNAQHSPVQFQELEQAFNNPTDWNALREKVRTLILRNKVAEARVEEARMALAAHQVSSQSQGKEEDRTAALNTEIARLESEKNRILVQLAGYQARLEAHEKEMQKLAASGLVSPQQPNS